MSTHRRPGPRVPRRILPIMLGVALLVLGGLAAPSLLETITGGDERQDLALTSLPDNAPDQGLVYTGLEPAEPGAICEGTYQLDEQTCTHGPSNAPTGLRASRAVTPVTAKAPEPVQPTRETSAPPTDAEIARDEGGSALTADAPALVPDAAPGEAEFVIGAHGVACEGDGRSGRRVQVLYLHEFGTPSRFSDFAGSIRVWAAGADQIFDLSAAQTGGSRHVRFVTTPQCQVDVSEVQVPTGALKTFQDNIKALSTLGYNRTDRKYLVFADSTVYCGIATFIADKRPGAGNRNNGGPSYGRVDAGCWSSVMAARELTYTFGASLIGSPNASGAGGCLDEYDLLCESDRSGKPVRTVCPKKNENRLDCGNDDYFSTNPKPGSFVDKNWNVADSAFLLRGDGGGDASAEPAPPAEEASTAPRTAESETQGTGTAPVPRTNLPAQAAATAEAAPAVIEVRDPSRSTVRLVWTAASAKATYEVWVDGAPIATTKATRARLIGLKPDTKYQVTVKSGTKYRAKATAETAPAARPAQNSWFTLTNALTGGAADLYAARTANGTPITLSGTDDDAQQQWQLVPADNGSYSLVSRATGKCVLPLDGRTETGQPLVQGDCAGTAGALWTLQASDHGFTMRLGDLVAGVGEQRFGTHRVLVLQEGNGQRHQSWTAVPD